MGSRSRECKKRVQRLMNSIEFQTHSQNPLSLCHFIVFIPFLSIAICNRKPGRMRIRRTQIVTLISPKKFSLRKAITALAVYCFEAGQNEEVREGEEVILHPQSRQSSGRQAKEQNRPSCDQTRSCRHRNFLHHIPFPPNVQTAFFKFLCPVDATIRQRVSGRRLLTFSPLPISWGSRRQ